MDAIVRDLCIQARQNGVATPWNGAPGLGALFLTGPDSVSFLQSQLTSDVHQLEPGQVQLSARLSRTGGLVAWFRLCRMPDLGQPFPGFLMVLPAAEVAGLVADLEHHRVSEDVLMEDASAEFEGWILEGAGREQALVSLPNEPGVMVFHTSFVGEAGSLVLWRSGTEPVIDTADMARLDDGPAARNAWRCLEIEAGWPRAGKDFIPGKRVLPQTGLEGQVVSLTKGCFLGQEVVARIRTYGSVPQALRGLVLSGSDDWPEPGSKLVKADGTAVGTWATSGYSAAWDAPIALAYLNREHRTPGLELELAEPAGATARVALLPLFQGGDHAEKARHLHDRAVHLFSTGHDDQAVALLEESLRLDPSQAEVFEALGVILGRSERFHEAINIFKRLEEVAPDEPMVHTNLSLFYMKIGDIPEAENQKALATLKRFSGDDPEVLESQNVARREEAARKAVMFGEVLEVDPEDPLALMGMGNALVDLERFEEAAALLERALAGQSENSPLYLARGKALEQLGNAADAASTYRQGIEVASRKGDLMPLREMEHRLLMLQAEL